MGSDLRRLLNPDTPSASRSPAFSLPRLSELDVRSNASVAAPSSAIFASSSSSVRDRAGLQQPHSRPGPQLTPPPTSSQHDPPQFSASLPTSSWTAVNHPPRTASFDESRGTGSHSRDPASVHFGQRRQTPPQAIALPSQPVTSPSSHFQHDISRQSPNSFRSGRQDSAVAVSTACTTQARIPTSVSPNFAYFQYPSSSLDPTTPPSPAPSPILDSQVNKPSVQRSTPGQHPFFRPNSFPPPSAPQGLTAFVPDIWTSPNGPTQGTFPVPIPRPRRRRSNSVRFVEQPVNMSMMPPPSPLTRHGDVGTRDTSATEQAYAQPNGPSTANLPHVPVATIDHAPMNGIGPSLSGSEPSAAAKSMAKQTIAPHGNICINCQNAVISDLESEIKGRQQVPADSIHNSSVEDHNKKIDELLNSLRNSRERSELARETCTECGSSPEESIRRVKIFLVNRAAEGDRDPMEVLLRDSKRKSPSADASSDADMSVKSRKTTPGSPSQELCEYTPPPDAAVSANKKGPRFTFAEAEGIFSPFTATRSREEELELDSYLTRLPWLRRQQD